jgi:hypothetical protein
MWHTRVLHCLFAGLAVRLITASSRLLLVQAHKQVQPAVNSMQNSKGGDARAAQQLHQGCAHGHSAGLSHTLLIDRGNITQSQRDICTELRPLAAHLHPAYVVVGGGQADALLLVVARACYLTALPLTVMHSLQQQHMSRQQTGQHSHGILTGLRSLSHTPDGVSAWCHGVMGPRPIPGRLVERGRS